MHLYDILDVNVLLNFSEKYEEIKVKLDVLIDVYIYRSILNNR